MKTLLIVALLTCFAAAQNSEETESVDTENLPKRHNRLTFEFGFGNMKDDTKSDAQQWAKDYNEKLCNGKTLSASWMSYWPSSPFGMGLLVSKYWASASQNNLSITLQPSGQTITGTMSDDISIIFLGIPLGLRSSSKESSIEISGDVRIGGLFYFDDFAFANVTTQLSSPTLGLGGSLSAELKVNKNFGIFAGVTGTYASVSSLYVKDGDKEELDEPLSLNRLDINLGIRIHFETDANSSNNNYERPYTPPPSFR
ncbi:MAG: hypothetical protein JNL74_07490 [Fibrobacteres bacterium]|nr:hypothetical protein [Fibrobacterota bacterium]